VPYTGVPQPGQAVRIFASNQNETIRLLGPESNTFQVLAIEDDNAIERKIRLIHHHNGVPALAPEDIADTLRALHIANCHLHGFHVP